MYWVVKYLSERFGAGVTSLLIDIGAYVRFLASVNPHVLLERGILGERLSTSCEGTRLGNVKKFM